MENRQDLIISFFRTLMLAGPNFPIDPDIRMKFLTDDRMSVKPECRNEMLLLQAERLADLFE